MKNKKNLLCALMLAGLLSFSLIGCGESGNESNSNNSDTGINTESPNDSTGGDSDSSSSDSDSSSSGGDSSSSDGDSSSSDGDSSSSGGDSSNSDDDSSSSDGDSSGGGDVGITHKTYEEIEGEPVRVVAPIAEGNVKGYSVKICPCGEELQGDYTVLVTVKLNSTELATQTVKVGAGLAALTLPTRDGYTLKLYKNGEEYALTETFDNFATVELTSRWFYTETDYDYKTDAEAKIAALTSDVTIENAETLLEQIAAIEAIIDTHYTEEEKAGAAPLAELKAAAEAVMSKAEYQLNKKLAAIPEFESMTDESAALFAVLDYIVYYNGVKGELSDYSEPRKISIYKRYFSEKEVVITDFTSKVTSNGRYEAPDIVMDGAEDNTYTFTLPKLPYTLFNELSAITVFGMANPSYTFNAYGTTFKNTGNAWNWFKVLKVGTEGKTLGDGTVLAEGYYFTIGNTDVGSEWYTYVKLSDAVVNGEEGLTFTVTTQNGETDWMKFRQDADIEASNFVGKLDEIQSDATVHTVTYSYKDGAGEQTITQYYLDGESLELPELSLTYKDKVGTHTFSGWGETADVVTGDLTYTAIYETVYKNYTVIFLDAEYNVFEEKDGYKYGDKVVLPTDTPEKAKEGDWKFEFIGWFNGDDEVTSETLVEKNVEIEPRFKPVYDGACYVLTIESEGLETQTYNIPALTDLQAEALSLIPALERNGYTFAGYINKETNETVDVANLTLSSDVTIVANWTPNYIAMAETLPESVEEITNEDQTYSDLVAYLSYVANNPVEGYEEPANVTALKAHYAGARKIYTFTSTSDSNVTTSARFETVQAKPDTWYCDDQKVLYGGFIQATFDTADGAGYIVLPKINYAFYSEVSFGIYGSSNTQVVQVGINGSSATLDNSGGIYYVVEIHGKTLDLHQMNNAENVLFTATLTDAQYNGIEGLKLDVIENGWSCVQISHILGTQAYELKDVSFYTVTFVDYDGTVIEMMDVVGGATMEHIIPDHDMYIFKEWIKDGVAFDFNTPITEDITLVATWQMLVESAKPTEKIYTYVSTEDLAVTGNLNKSIGTKADAWYQDDQGVNYDGFYNMTFDLGDGDYIVTLTKINYILYSEVSFGLYTGIAGTISITINGQTCSSFVSDGFYVVEINGKNLNIHKMNEPANVLLTATLTDAQYNGTEALTLNITESGWSNVQISHILGTQAYELKDVAFHTVTFTNMVGENIVQSVSTGNKVERPEDPTRPNCTFGGWYTENGEEFDFDAGISEDTVIVAHWYTLVASVKPTEKIYTFTSTSDSNVTTSARFESVQDKPDAWYQDDQGNAYGGFIQATFDTADGEGWIVLPKINYALYSEVSFAVYGSGNPNAVQVGINGSSATLDNSGGIYYVVEIHGKTLDLHQMNNAENVLFTATLTDAQYNGTEGLKLTVIENGWSCVQVSHILGTQAYVLEEVTACNLTADSTEEEYVAYMQKVNNFTAYEKSLYVEPSIVATLRAKYAVAKKIYTFTSTSDSNVTTSARFESVQNKADAWYQDDQGNAYGGFIQATFDGTADGEGYVVLPKINYALYSEVSFAIYTSSNTQAVQIAINGSSATLDNGGGIYYVVEIHGRTLELHQMNNPANVLFTATLTDAQYNGTEGLKIDVIENGWSCVQISHILGTLA